MFAPGVLEQVPHTSNTEGELITAGYLPAGTGQMTVIEPENLNNAPMFRRNDCDILGKKRQRREEIAHKRLKGENLTLDEKRAEEAQDVKPILKQHQPNMLHIKDWLRKNFADKLSKKKFNKLGGMFCDGIILPRLAVLFPKYNEYEAFLRLHKLEV